ncbi:protein-L-isoaspartate O-methyltransferase domain-containing protein 1-like [Lineus longissimus]|uniref:protein-L-isoaspartate O-methyltransferase domain-containing protein 1-like n=1 Tax=Lineus longissimus TaxID=88925 RepID=UPI00315DF08A
MGGAVSAGEDNDDLVDNLVDADYIKTPGVEKVFRAVDRASYYLPDHRDSAYKDLAWKHGNLHLSAPCIYSEVMESLKLKSSLSFLNLGSGTGYLSTMVGLILGPYGMNHGVEIHPDVVNYASEKLEEFKKNCDAFDEFEFCEPEFVVGNCLLLNGASKLYDRVYCGAACPQEHENYMKNLIRIGGILVMPVNDQLLQVTRTGETTWESKTVLPVSFASLVEPSRDKNVEMVELPETATLNLQEICRITIRKILRDVIQLEHPQNGRKKRKKPKKKRANKKRVNIVPMSMGMMILSHFDSDSDDDMMHLNHPRFSTRDRDAEMEDMASGSDSETEVKTKDVELDVDEGEKVTEDKSEDSACECDREEHDAVWKRRENRSSREENGQRIGLRHRVRRSTSPVLSSGERDHEMDPAEMSCDQPVSEEKRRQRGESESSLSTGEKSDVYGTSPGGNSTADTETSGLGTLFSSDRSANSSSADVSPSTSADASEGTIMTTIEEEGNAATGDVTPPKIKLGDLLKRFGGRQYEGEDEEQMDLSDEEEEQTPRESYRIFMKEKVNQLPIPEALKAYCLYYRN